MLRSSEHGYLPAALPIDGENDSSDTGSEVIESPYGNEVRRNDVRSNMVMVDQLWLWILGGNVSRSASLEYSVARLTRAKILS